MSILSRWCFASGFVVEFLVRYVTFINTIFTLLFRYSNSSSKSRLVREDENDGSDDEEETVQMAVPSAARDRDRKREAFMSVQNEDVDQESDKGEEEEWESQQIRKGVTGAQVRKYFVVVVLLFSLKKID